MYLAIVSTTLDDIPICLAKSQTLAKCSLESCTADDVVAAERILGRDPASMYLAVCRGLIVRFDEHGKLAECSKSIELPQFDTCIGPPTTGDSN